MRPGKSVWMRPTPRECKIQQNKMLEQKQRNLSAGGGKSLRRSKSSVKRRKNKYQSQYPASPGGNKLRQTEMNDIHILQEAYQYLLKKYCTPKKKQAEVKETNFDIEMPMF